MNNIENKINLPFITFFRKLIIVFYDFFLYYFYCGANKVQFLRIKGVNIGGNCEILNDTKNYGSEPWLIDIGNRVTITKGVLFLTHDASSRLFREKIDGGSKFGNRFGVIKINDNCFIGVNTIILPGVEVGPNSIVGAGSVLTKNIPPDSVFAGVPAKRIGSLDEYVQKYQSRMIKITSNNRSELRKELTKKFWGKER